MYNLQKCGKIIGMSGVSLQTRCWRAWWVYRCEYYCKYHEDRGIQSVTPLVPDSEHGTNPATVAMAGFEVVNIPTDASGNTM